MTAIPGRSAIPAVQARIAGEVSSRRYVALSSTETETLAGASTSDWSEFAAEWDHLTLDRYMSDGGTYRLRRYSRFSLDVSSGDLSQLPHGPYQQSRAVNSLNGGIERHFDPCRASFCENQALRRLLLGLGMAFTQADGGSRWDIKLHPYRILASTGETGQPAPEGRHSDGVTFVMTLMIARHQVVGGRSTIFSESGAEIISTTLSRRGELLICDDRLTTHSVTPISPVEGFTSGHRDVLVIAFTAAPMPALHVG
ncbi:MAG: 2OG-Fe dioxygenase family protein [Jatrophihabitantaceae bacterium]